MGAATIAVSNLPGASLVNAAEAATPEKALPKGAERLNFGLPNQEAVVARPVTAIVIGAGSRGSVYASYSL